MLMKEEISLVEKLARWRSTKSLPLAAEICEELCTIYFEDGEDNED